MGLENKKNWKYKKGLRQSLSPFVCLSDSGEIRTHDPRFRRPLLYPAELPNHTSNRYYYIEKEGLMSIIFLKKAG